jgi:hypothetical protein
MTKQPRLNWEDAGLTLTLDAGVPHIFRSNGDLAWLVSEPGRQRSPGRRITRCRRYASAGSGARRKGVSRPVTVDPTRSGVAGTLTAAA